MPTLASMPVLFYPLGLRWSIQLATGQGIQRTCLIGPPLHNGSQSGMPLVKFESEIQESINISSAGLALSMSTSPFTTHTKNQLASSISLEHTHPTIPCGRVQVYPHLYKTKFVTRRKNSFLPGNTLLYFESIERFVGMGSGGWGVIFLEHMSCLYAHLALAQSLLVATEPSLIQHSHCQKHNCNSIIQQGDLLQQDRD